MLSLLRNAALTVLLLTVTGTTVLAAFPVPSNLENASEEEISRHLQTEGEFSLREKLQVGKQRYDERQALRRALVDAMWRNREKRRAALTLPRATTPASTRDPVRPETVLLWLAGIGFVGLCVVRYAYTRRAEF